VTIYPADGDKSEEQLATGTGYDHELAYFIKCIADGVAPAHITLVEGVNAVRIAGAEKKSIATGKTVEL